VSTRETTSHLTSVDLVDMSKHLSFRWARTIYNNDVSEDHEFALAFNGCDGTFRTAMQEDGTHFQVISQGRYLLKLQIND